MAYLLRLHGNGIITAFAIDSVFGSTFVELILTRIDFVEINLVRIDFEVKWFMFDSSSKSNFDRK